MTNGPACTTCGSPLRWVAEQHAWACDRCRQMFPATQPQAMPVPMAPPPQMPMQPHVQMQPAHMRPQPPPMQAPPMQAPMLQPGPMPMPAAVPAMMTPTVAPAPKKRSKKLLIIALAVLVVGGGATTAIVLATRGGAAGAASRDELASAFVTAIGAGDVDALQTMTDPAVAGELEAECAPAAPVDKAPAVKAMRERVQKFVDEHKSQQLVAGALDETASSVTKVTKGQDLGGTCKAKVEFTTHAVTFHLTGQMSGKPRSLIARLALAEIDGRWFLTQLPDLKPTGTCKTATTALLAASKDSLEAINVDLDKVRTLVLAHCKADAWTEEMLGCLVDAKVDKDVEKCMGQRTPEQVAAFDPAMTDLVNASRPIALSGLSPSTGELGGGTEVTIKGSNFLPDRSAARKVTVTIDGKPADVIRIASDTELVIKTPEGATNGTAVDVVVQFEGLQPQKLPGAYTYGDAPPAGEASAEASGGDVPTACQDYGDMIERLSKCAAFPKAGLDGLRQGYTQMKSTMDQMKGNPALAKSMGDACKAAVDAIKQATASLGC